VPGFHEEREDPISRIDNQAPGRGDICSFDGDSTYTFRLENSFDGGKTYNLMMEGTYHRT
jgi:hypothetical protein